jgi:ferric-dicitrate binding protein FerR (iron transport regulator)
MSWERKQEMNGELESLMRDVGRVVEGEAQRQNILPQVQARLAARQSLRARPAQRANGRWSVALAFGSLAACAATAIIVLHPRAISYAVAGVGEGEVGAALVAPAAAPMELQFSDGSAVTLPPRAAAHVDALDRNGATVAIEEGTLEVSVIHRAHTRWQVQAGGYRIQVTGTRFAAGWDRSRRALTVTMHEGSVLVSGPGLKEPVRVVTGQRLRASASGADLGLENAPAPSAEVEAPPAAPTPSVATSRAPEPALAPPPTEIQPSTERASAPRARRVEAVATRAATPINADWRIQAARAEYHEALAAAVLEGWRAECARLGADDLVLLGDVARLAGDLDRAEEAYRSARRRFPGADRPIYALGLIAFEGRHNYKLAGDLFAGYLRSFPRGPLAREAGGRLLESRLKAGDDAEARQAAAAYLHDFPGGPYAALARRTVGP